MNRSDGASRRNVPLAVKAYEEIKRRIVEGTMPPGYPILETELAADLGISRTPVREALARLQHEDLVFSIRRKGVMVSSMSVDDMKEIGEMLEGLEGMAVKLASERATEADLRRLENAVRAQEQALKKDDRQMWSVADEEFHNAILDAARNRRMQEAVSRVRVHWRRQQALTIRLRPKPTLSTESHRATLEAIKAHNGELARQIDQRHRAQVNSMLMNLLRSFDSRSVRL